MYKRQPYDTTYTEDSTHYEGTSTIVQEGVKGTERVTANVSYINGIETRRKVIERVTIEAVSYTHLDLPRRKR